MAHWTKDDLVAALRRKGWLTTSRDIEHGIQFELKENVKINFYNTGTITVGGPKNEFKSKIETFVDDGPGKMPGEADASRVQGKENPYSGFQQSTGVRRLWT